MVEQPAHNRLVAGSIPAGPTTSGLRAKYWRILGRIRSKGTGQFLLLFCLVPFHRFQLPGLVSVLTRYNSI